MVDYGKIPRWRRVRNFLVGLILMAAVYMLPASGYSPPGICGEVLRHNQEHDIDASPFWYMDVEKMSEYEAAVAAMRSISFRPVVDSSNSRNGD